MIPLFLVFVLYLIGAIQSDVGLDIHVRGSYVPEGDGYLLDWGDTRPVDPLASDPDDSELIEGGGFSPAFFSLLAVFGIFFAYLLASKMFQSKGTIVVLLVNPALVFSYGRGYDEFLILSLMGLSWLLWSQNRRPETDDKMRAIQILTAATCISFIPAMKFLFNPVQWFVTILLLWGIALIVEFSSDEWFAPRRLLAGGFGFGCLAIILLGIAGIGSFSVITTETTRFLQAWPVAVFGVLIVYGMIGMSLWPFARQTWEKMGESDDRTTGELALLIGTLSGVMVTYVACLWVFESVRWGGEWPWHMWTLGNNGRYITILAIPAYLLVERVNGGIDWSEKKALVAVAMILPLSLAAGLHGQSYWTDEAATFLSDDMGEDDDFLFVHDATLGMHYLYTFHTYIEDAHARNITGHWRAPDSGWQEELGGLEMENRGNITGVRWVVLSPDTEWMGGSPDGWELVTSGEADYFNGGGEWQIWKSDGGVAV